MRLNIMLRAMGMALLLSGCASGALTTVIDGQAKAIEAALPTIQGMCRPALQACELAKAQQSDQHWQCPALTACHDVQSKLVALLLHLEQIALAAVDRGGK